MYSLHVLLAKSIVGPALNGFSNLHSTMEIGYSDSVATKGKLGTLTDYSLILSR